MSLAPLRTLLNSKKPLIMGVINITPDSFSDGGQHTTPQNAIKSGLEMIEQGAHILDIGGESSRPGATPVTPDEEMRRVLPVIEGLVKEKAHHHAHLSIDSYHAATMAAAIQAGVTIINDITALEGEAQSLPLLADIARDQNISEILMHMHGQPQIMQDNPTYQNNVTEEIMEYLAKRVEVCTNAGIPKENLIVDPGIGFGKTLDHNLEILNQFEKFKSLNLPLLIGVSRKSFISQIDRNMPADQRLGGSLAACLSARQRGAHIFRVHDVDETRQALAVWDAITHQIS